MHTLIVFASGQGSNARAIHEYFSRGQQARIGLIVCNRADAGVLIWAQQAEIPTWVVDRQTFMSEDFLRQLQTYQPSLIVLAGFLWKIPDALVAVFRNKIVNIHPALLPDFGGKGMYGGHVHRAVIEAGKKESGITIHYVDEVYDSGDIIMQARCPVHPDDDDHTLAGRIHRLEHFFFPRTLEYLLQTGFDADGQYTESPSV